VDGTGATGLTASRRHCTSEAAAPKPVKSRREPADKGVPRNVEEEEEPAEEYELASGIALETALEPAPCVPLLETAPLGAALAAAAACLAAAAA